MKTCRLSVLAVGAFAAVLLRAAPAPIVNNTVWYDTQGDPILCQGGDILKYQGVYYWYGVEMYTNSTFYAIRCYSSTDLSRWVREDNAIENGDPTTTSDTADMTNPGWVGRPSVLYRAAVGSTPAKFIMTYAWAKNGSGNMLAFADSDSPTGPFVMRSKTYVNGMRIGDCSMFQDGAVGYVVTNYASSSTAPNAHGRRAILRLTTNYMGIDTMVYNSTNTTEGHAILKRGNNFIWTSSGIDGWGSTESYHSKSGSVAAWAVAPAEMPTSPGSPDSFDSQHDFINQLPGTAGTVTVYYGDRWSNRGGSTGLGRYVWNPVSWSASDVPTIIGRGSWAVDVAAGTWSEALVVDNDDTGYTDSGNWNANTGAGAYRGDWRGDGNTGATGGKWAKYAPTGLGGTYKVYAYWKASATLASNATFRIFHVNGAVTHSTLGKYTDFTVNQRLGNNLIGQWTQIGTVGFVMDSTDFVTIRNNGANGYVIADGVMFVKQ
jgi:hypothetical protein